MRIPSFRFLPAPLSALILAAMLLPAAPAPVAAGGFGCESLWFMRNLIAHRAGVCFGTPLGQATFGNAGCVAGAAPGPDGAARMRQIAGIERLFGCQVDTEARALDAWVAGWDWSRIETVPTAREVNASCMSYQGPALTLHAAPRDAAPVTGTLQAGLSLGIFSEEENGWIFVRVDTGSDNLGWVRTAPWFNDITSCEMWLP